MRRARWRRSCAKAVASIGTLVATAAAPYATVLPSTARAAATTAVRVRPAPAVQITREPVAGRRAGRHRGGGRRPPRRVREELSLRQPQAQDEGARQGEQARVEAPVYGKPAVSPRRRRRGRKKL